MADPAAIIAAVAAAGAAALSAVTLYLTGKREQTNWRRDAVIESIVEFSGGSYSRFSERAFNARRAGDSFERYVRRADDGLRRQNAALTRLRLLASNEVVARAEAVQREDEVVTAWFRDVRNDTTVSWEMLNAARQNVRQSFLSAYRQAFGFGEAKNIVSNSD